MTVQALVTDASVRRLLPGAQFADTFRVATNGASLNARQAAERMLGRQPRWIAALMRLRNAIVTPLGLKTPSHARPMTVDSIGAFPVITETPERIVAGFDDKHLDFRVVVDVSGSPPGQVTATTLVKTHNLLGRAYLATIMPFHRVIVPAMLRQI
ncbi:MAG: DUF2867 domain-containing protein [Pseudolabrys sp.]|jgi:hypothetical protein